MSQSGSLSPTLDSADLEPPPVESPTRGRRRLPRWLIAVITAVALIAAGIAAGAVSYWSSVELSPMVPLPATTTLYYADGETVLARLGDADRTELAYEEILPAVVDVTLAAEDPVFWSNAAGPITRAVVRTAFDLSGTGNNARVRTWVLAHKLEAAYPKEHILAWYLNAVPFGRMAYGIEAAARAYFGKSASSSADPAQQLTAAEAMVLLAIVDQPNPDAADPEAFPGFDPAFSDAAEANSRERWVEIRDALAEQVSTGRATSLSPDEVSSLSYPMPQPPADGPGGLALPIGLVAGHILSELTRTAGSHFEGWSWDAVRSGGFDITTTIDVRAQQALEAAADETVAGSSMSDQPDNLQAAGVVVEAGTGRALAYYGGHDGLGTDYAGVHRGEDGTRVGFGAHPPGSSFMIYTLAAALKAGYSLNSQWQWTPHEQVGRSPDNPVRNTGRCETNPNGPACSLLDSVVHRLNVPLYDVAASVSVPAVLAMARDAGISALWNDQREHIELTADVDASGDGIGLPVAYGQYPATVLDQAAAMATFAGGAVPAPVHFVREVSQGDLRLYGEVLPAADDAPLLSAGQLADLAFALTSISGQADLALITGNWTSANTGLNSQVWSIGFTSELAVAIWVGNRGDEQPLYDRNGGAVWGAGLPTQMLRQVVAETQAELNLRPEPFPAPDFGGDLNPPGSLPPAG